MGARAVRERAAGGLHIRRELAWGRGARALLVRVSMGFLPIVNDTGRAGRADGLSGPDFIP